MSTYDTEIKASFYDSLEAARNSAEGEALNVGGIALELRAIEFRRTRVLLIGQLPEAVVERPRNVGLGRSVARPLGVSRLHTTWDVVLGLRSPVGFLVIQRPVRLISGELWSSDGAMAWVAFEVIRNQYSIPEGFRIGPVCCGECNEPIAATRLTAKPNATLCINCQTRKEIS